MRHQGTGAMAIEAGAAQGHTAVCSSVTPSWGLVIMTCLDTQGLQNPFRLEDRGVSVRHPETVNFPEA